jgi:Peroxidase
MRRFSLAYLLLCPILGANHGANAAFTWPSSIDELEDIMFLSTGYRSKGFNSLVIPCSFSSADPTSTTRMNSAEWLRTAFHDMATANVYLGTGGMDASLVFELGGDNIGPAFATTITNMAPFLTTKSSMADLFSMGVYSSVRSCGGPIVPVRTGRVDATTAGSPGVPLPQNSLFTFQNQFVRMGFNATEMIQLVACGHTIGGVHSANFPQIVPPSTAFQQFDTTRDAFDNRVITEFVANNSVDPMTSTFAASSGRAADTLIFNSDKPTTNAMVNAATFQSVCQNLLQRMIEVVPPGVVLTTQIVVYEVKPMGLQLSLLPGGTQLSLTGDIRVRTTSRAANQIATVQLLYTDRNGNIGGTITTVVTGTAAGFDDTFSVSTSGDLSRSL